MLNIKNLSEAKELTSKEMSAVVGGERGTLEVIVDTYKEIGAAVGQAAGYIYCGTQGKACGAATVPPKSPT